MPVVRPKQYQLLFKKGSVDLAVAEHLIRLNAEDIDQDVILFHCQQAAEKFLKTLLSKSGVHFEKTYDLIELLELCSVNKMFIPEYVQSFENLYPYAVQGRYDFVSDATLDPRIYCNRLNEFKIFV